MATTAPHRDDRPKVADGAGKRPERLGRLQRPRSVRTTWSKLVMVLNVVLIAGVVIIGLGHVGTEDATDRSVAADPGGPASTLPDPDAVPSQSPPNQPVTGAQPPGPPSLQETTAPSTQPSSQPPATDTPTADTGTSAAPRVPTRMRSSFADGDGWPYGAGFRETGRLAWPLGVVDRLMTHGAPQAPNAVSWLEKWLKTDVRTIGARVLFAPNHSGSAALTAWHTSVLDTSGLQEPRTGMRLVVQPGAWQLVALDLHGQSVLGSGTYTQTGHSASFSMVRRDSTIWVTDPEGRVTSVDDPRIGSLSGPWASWELRDAKPGSRPAGFQEIWAG